jgi:tRNA nucleotidyltransferase/poly(A) polymerase
VAGPSAGRRGLPLKSDPAIRRCFRTLMSRPDVAEAASLAQPGDRVRAVGGAVRDAFLGRRGADLDLVAPPKSAERLATELATRAGSRVVPIGIRPKRILKVPFRSHEIDVWEDAGDPEADLLRRDFTVNALSFSLPDGAFSSAPGALADLRARRLAPPRPGVFLEDPLRVLRAARFLAELPGFRVATRAVPEMKKAGRFLRMVPAERRLVELDKLLGAPAADRTRALRFLERVGALQSLLLGTAPRERHGILSTGTAASIRRGIALVERLREPDARVARCLLLLPLGRDEAVDSLGRWKVSREELRLASRLYALPLRGPRRTPTRRDVAALLRFSSPFEAESVAFLGAAGDRHARDLAAAAEAILSRPSSLRRILKPRRPLSFEEIRTALDLPEGPRLGDALAAFDLALASSEIRSARAARAWIRRFRKVPHAPQRLLK